MALSLRACAWRGEPPVDLKLEEGEEILVIERRPNGLPPIKVSLIIGGKGCEAWSFSNFAEIELKPALAQLGIEWD